MNQILNITTKINKIIKFISNNPPYFYCKSKVFSVIASSYFRYFRQFVKLLYIQHIFTLEELKLIQNQLAEVKHQAHHQLSVNGRTHFKYKTLLNSPHNTEQQPSHGGGRARVGSRRTHVVQPWLLPCPMQRANYPLNLGLQTSSYCQNNERV